jgi:hypothetical protein
LQKGGVVALLFTVVPKSRGVAVEIAAPKISGVGGKEVGRCPEMPGCD